MQHDWFELVLSVSSVFCGVEVVYLGSCWSRTEQVALSVCWIGDFCSSQTRLCVKLSARFKTHSCGCVLKHLSLRAGCLYIKLTPRGEMDGRVLNKAEGISCSFNSDGESSCCLFLSLPRLLSASLSCLQSLGGCCFFRCPEPSARKCVHGDSRKRSLGWSGTARTPAQQKHLDISCFLLWLCPWKMNFLQI